MGILQCGGFDFCSRLWAYFVVIREKSNNYSIKVPCTAVDFFKLVLPD